MNVKPDWVKTAKLDGCWTAAGTSPDGIWHEVYNGDNLTEQDAVEDLLFSIREIRKEQRETEDDA